MARRVTASSRPASTKSTGRWRKWIRSRSRTPRWSKRMPRRQKRSSSRLRSWMSALHSFASPPTATAARRRSCARTNRNARARIIGWRRCASASAPVRLQTSFARNRRRIKLIGHEFAAIGPRTEQSAGSFARRLKLRRLSSDCSTQLDGLFDGGAIVARPRRIISLPRPATVVAVPVRHKETYYG
jgi:hypothetical protein